MPYFYERILIMQSFLHVDVVIWSLKTFISREFFFLFYLFFLVWAPCFFHSSMEMPAANKKFAYFMVHLWYKIDKRLIFLTYLIYLLFINIVLFKRGKIDEEWANFSCVLGPKKNKNKWFSSQEGTNELSAAQHLRAFGNNISADLAL